MTTTFKTPVLTLKKLKTMEGREGLAFSADVYVDGKKAAYARDDGNGGEMFVDWTPSRKPGGSIWESEVKDRLEEWCAGQPHVTCPDGCGGTFTYALDVPMLINREIDRMMEEKQLKTWCRTKTLFRIEGDGEGEYRTIKMKFKGNEDKIKAHLAKKYGAKLVEIVNERFAA